MSDQSTEKVSVISQKTLVPLGLVFSILGSGWYFNKGTSEAIDDMKTQVVDLKYRVTSLEARITAIELSYDRKSGDRWTGTHQSLWRLEMLRLNPTLNIPTVASIIDQYPQAK